MTANNLRRYTPLLIHVLAWGMLSFLLLLYIPLTWKVAIPKVFWMRQVLMLVVLLVMFYLNAWLIVPNTLIKNKRAAFALCTLGIIGVVQVVAYIHSSLTNFHEEITKIFGLKTLDDSVIDDFVLMLTLLVIGISTSYAMLQNWRQAEHRHEQLEQQQMMAELSLLKAQINPHFFFNTLNNIYSLTYIDVEDSRKALHTLSRMMRYLLYGTESEKTTLTKEVDFIRDYISLMRLRSSDELRIVVSFPEKMNDYPIAPMLLLPFVENAFKHGVDATEQSEIKVILTQEKQQIDFEVINNISVKNNIQEQEGGIGLTNTRRRLQLIYPDKHQLVAGINNHGNYEVNLSLELEK